MRLTFRVKLLSIVAATAVAFCLVILISTLIGVREARHLTDVENRLLPKLELGPQLEADFERLRQTLKDAASAQDGEVLSESQALMARLIRHVSDGRAVMDRGVADALVAKLEDYYRLAYDVSRRLVARETGEAIVEAMAQMQARQAAAEAAIKQAARLDRNELTQAFAGARRARTSAATYRLAISVGALALVLALSVWFSRGILRVVDKMSNGFARFGRGDFTQPIDVGTPDELGDVARDANQMATNLLRLNEERDHIDWLKAGLGGLTHELRGELEPEEVADRAVRYLAGFIDAPVGALYYEKQPGTLTLLGRCALADPTSSAAGPFTGGFRLGEGLVGRAAMQTEILELNDVPPDHLRVRSGLGESVPRQIVLIPILHLGKVKGVIELGLFRPLTKRGRELLGSVRESLVIALEVAGARASMREMLAESQRQAQQLILQEQELRANNEELQVQQEELRQANEELDLQRATLEQQNAELEEARRSLQQKASELVSVSSYKSRFLANMSHELRTPLNSMLILSELMARNEGKNLTDKQVEYSRTIHGAGKDLLALINQVLDLSKIEAGKQQLHVAPTPLEEILVHVRRIFEPLATDKGLNFSIELGEGVPSTINTDRQRLEQVLTNLLGNAVKFTREGRVGLRIERAPRTVRFRRGDLMPEGTLALAVFDTGVGIAAKDQELVFAPFERLETKTDHRYGGTGLGLSIARELCLLLGGELHLKSTVGHGSTFTCYLPARGPKEVTTEVPSVSAPPVAPADDRKTIAAEAFHLLLIEDDPVFAQLLTEIIRARGFKVLVATTGTEGLELAKRHRPSGIILDVKLPDMEGWTVMDRLRSQPETKEIPVHFLSAVDAPERGWAMGAVGYLTKPASHQELVAMVQTLAPQAAKRPEQILVVEAEVANGESLVQLLAKEGLDARKVKSGRDAFSALAQDHFVCVVLDLSLPDMDGLGFLEALKTRDDVERPPVVVYTGRALTKEEARRIEEYAEAVVLKEGRSTERLLEEIRLFLHHVEDRLGREKPRPPVRAQSGDRSFRGKKVLVVDDDMRTVYALSALLRAKGVEVLMADTGRAAIEVLEEGGAVDAVLMDVMMPEMDGYEAMRRIRHNPKLAEVPIIALTAKAMKGERERCLEAGASDYLSKPIDNDELLTLLGTWLAPLPAPESEEAAYGS